jgi:hypothetical protein
MAIIAACLAIVSVLGQHFNTETLLNQQLASDQWAFYQAKDIRRYIAQVTGDSLAQMKADDATIQKYAKDSARYDADRKHIQEEAKEFLRERDSTGRRANRFHFSEVFLEVAIVFSSLAILSRRKPLFVAGIGSALIGVVLALTAAWA